MRSLPQIFSILFKNALTFAIELSVVSSGQKIKNKWELLERIFDLLPFLFLLL